MIGRLGKRSSLGFTLIEILLATALLGIMMLILTGSLRVGADSWEAGEERLIRASRMFIVESFLSRHISTLVPASGFNSSGEMEPAFRGTDTTLSYVAALPDQLEGGGLYRFRLYLFEKADVKELRVSITLHQSAINEANTETKPIDDLAMVEDVKHLRFSYFGDPGGDAAPPSPDGPKGRWVDRWHEYQLPSMIRIEIEREGEEPWPTIIVAPKTLLLR